MTKASRYHGLATQCANGQKGDTKRLVLFWLTIVSLSSQVSLERSCKQLQALSVKKVSHMQLRIIMRPKTTKPRFRKEVRLGDSNSIWLLRDSR